MNSRTHFGRLLAPLLAACIWSASVSGAAASDVRADTSGVRVDASDVRADASGIADAARRAELVRLVRQDCGSCHGLTLQGGLGPALLPATLAGKPADALAATILRGRPGTPMPPWQRFLNQAEADWIVENLKKGFPNER